jgi:hypothetical protein
MMYASSELNVEIMAMLLHRGVDLEPSDNEVPQSHYYFIRLDGVHFIISLYIIFTLHFPFSLDGPHFTMLSRATMYLLYLYCFNMVLVSTQKIRYRAFDDLF